VKSHSQVQTQSNTGQLLWFAFGYFSIGVSLTPTNPGTLPPETSRFGNTKKS